jgi:alpha-glucosidase (family GH31 glycosyl hydrolase)
LHAEPTNAPLFWGPFASDPELYTHESLNGFDAWIGAGQLLSTPTLFEGQLSRKVYFPKSSADDKSIYFDLNAPHRQYVAGSTTEIATPFSEFGLFAREGAAIPVGKPIHTVTQKKGPSRTTTDGVDVQLESEGGVVGLDDWRGLKLFPSASGRTYKAQWTEDDGISSDPDKAIVDVEYSGGEKVVQVKLHFAEHAFKPLWDKTVYVLLPVGDERTVKGAEATKHEDRTAWKVEVA